MLPVPIIDGKLLIGIGEEIPRETKLSKEGRSTVVRLFGANVVGVLAENKGDDPPNFWPPGRGPTLSSRLAAKIRDLVTVFDVGFEIVNEEPGRNVPVVAPLKVAAVSVPRAELNCGQVRLPVAVGEALLKLIVVDAEQAAKK